jgi:hypothetical protein
MAGGGARLMQQLGVVAAGPDMKSPSVLTQDRFCRPGGTLTCRALSYRPSPPGTHLIRGRDARPVQLIGHSASTRAGRREPPGLYARRLVGSVSWLAVCAGYLPGVS